MPVFPLNLPANANSLAAIGGRAESPIPLRNNPLAQTFSCKTSVRKTIAGEDRLVPREVA